MTIGARGESTSLDRAHPPDVVKGAVAQVVRRGGRRACISRK